MYTTQNASNIGNVGVNAAKNGSINDTFASPINNADSLLEELTHRVYILAERLCGPIPPSTSQAKLEAVPSGGIFDGIGLVGNRMVGHLNEINDAVSRIERMLP